MRIRLSGVLFTCCLAAVGLGASCKDDNPAKPATGYACEDGEDNDLDGMVDFPEDPGCISASDDSEDSPAMAQCSDGRDNDMDGKTDYPTDPGCFAPLQDDEIDDCPDGPACPQCANGMDDDNNTFTDFPADQGCTAASDNDEFTRNLVACGAAISIQPLPGNNTDTGMFMPGQPSGLMSTCGGAGGEVAYELRITEPKVLVATTDTGGTDVDTVLYLRGADCANAATELMCNDDIATGNKASSITVSLVPGTYFLIVDAADNSIGGTFDLQVQFFVGEGIACASGDDCGPGLVCRVPANDTVKKCSQPVCNDGLDDDADGKMDFPNDPGCTSVTDETENDDCPTGPNCPECADGDDNDGDLMTDYPADLQCQSASSSAEACVSSEVVATITTAMTTGTTVGATNDFRPTCGTSLTHTAPDITYRLDLPPTTTLTIDLTEGPPSFSSASQLLNTTCGGTAIACSTGVLSAPNLAAGTYYYVVDGYSTASGPYTVTVSGTIAPAASCEGPLAVSGALTCGPGYACQGTAGSRICGPALCNDGLDNDGDGKKDYPFDPGCDSSADDTEGDTCFPTVMAGCPVCSDAMDNDTDTRTDFPNDYGCAAASGTSEVFCTGELEDRGLITTPQQSGTTVGASNDLAPGCGTSSAPDVTYALTLPVPVVTLKLDTEGSTFDTIMSFRNTTCSTVIECDDDDGVLGSGLQSAITRTNVPAGTYAITVDAHQANSGAYKLNVKGTVAAMTACTSPLFAAGVLECPVGTTCQTGTCRP